MHLLVIVRLGLADRVNNDITVHVIFLGLFVGLFDCLFDKFGCVVECVSIHGSEYLIMISVKYV